MATPGRPAARPDDITRSETLEKGHGRIERRVAEASNEVVPYLDWPGAAQVLRIERTREVKGKVSVEVAYFITSLPAAGATAQRLLDLARTHWAIENRLHWRRDASLNEDRCRVRAGARPLATLRNHVLSMLDRTGLSIPAARETFAADHTATINTVTRRIL